MDISIYLILLKILINILILIENLDLMKKLKNEISELNREIDYLNEDSNNELDNRNSC